MMKNTISDKHVLAFDGVRGFAVLWVLIYHATMTIYHHSPYIKAVLSFTHAGFLGVDVFFALSGFLITGILLDTKSKEPNIFFGRFFYRRALRIFPLYFGVILLLLVLPQLISALQGDQYNRFVEKQWWFWIYGTNVVAEYYGYKTSVLEFGWFALTHFWTLAIEEHFYLFWPFVIYFTSDKKLIPVALTLMFLSILVSLMFSDLPPMSLLAASLATFKHLGGLLIGAIGAISLRNFAISELLIKYSRMIFYAVMLSCILCLIMYPAADVTNFTIFHALVSVAVTSILVMASTMQQNLVTQFFEFKWLRFFGKYSYGIYVYHGILVPTFRSFHFVEWPGGHIIGALTYILLFCAPPVFIAMLSYHYFELPFLKLKDKFYA